MQPDIFIGVPVFDGADYLAETLRCIKRQTYPHFTANISIDGGDSESLEACAQIAGEDPRFRIAVAPERLGWERNLSQLMRDCDADFFCYWQQDDFAADDYLEALRKVSLEHPDTAISYADIQWFGGVHYREEATSVLGTRLERVLGFPEHRMHPPLRGLIRTSMLRRVSLIQPRGPDDVHTEFGFIARLASEGSLRRAPDTLYFKRSHPAQWHAANLPKEKARKRRTWILMGDQILDVALACAVEADRPRVIAAIVDRLCVQRPGRDFLDPDPHPQAARGFVRDFFALTGREPVDPGAIDLADPEWSRWPIAAEVLDALARERQTWQRRQRVTSQPGAGGDLVLDWGAPTGPEPLLGSGWHDPEEKGVWSTDEGRIYVPSPCDQVTLTGFCYGPEGHQVRVGWRDAAGGAEFIVTTTNAPLSLRIPAARLGLRASSSVPAVTLLLPDAIAPSRIGVSADVRQLGFFLQQVRLVGD